MSNTRFPVARRVRPLLVLAAVFVWTACGDGTSPTPEPPAFHGPYALDQWTATSILDGTTAITPATGEADTARFSYTVNLGNPAGGVSFRTASYSAVAANNGTVTLDWEYTGFHAFFATRAQLIVWAGTAGGQVDSVEIDQATGGGYSFSGSSAIAVEAGQPFGFTIGGSNFDSNSRLDGILKVFNFTAP